MDTHSGPKPKTGLIWWKWALLPLMTAVICMAYLWAKDLKSFQDPATARLVFWHVPMAILSMVWFLAAAIYSARYLLKGIPFDDTRAARAAEVGLLLTVLATVTGAVFSKMQWAGGFNSPWYAGYWQWDPKQTSIVITIVIYMAYFGLRMSVEEPGMRARFSAVYAILSFVAVPFLYYVIPQLTLALGQSIHPTGVIQGGMDREYSLTFRLSTLGFLGITTWAYQMRLRLDRLAERRIEGAGPSGGERVQAVRRSPIDDEQRVEAAGPVVAER